VKLRTRRIKIAAIARLPVNLPFVRLDHFQSSHDSSYVAPSTAGICLPAACLHPSVMRRILLSLYNFPPRRILNSALIILTPLFADLIKMNRTFAVILFMLLALFFAFPARAQGVSCGDDHGGDMELAELLKCACEHQKCMKLHLEWVYLHTYQNCNYCYTICHQVAGSISNKDNRDVRAWKAGEECFKRRGIVLYFQRHKNGEVGKLNFSHISTVSTEGK